MSDAAKYDYDVFISYSSEDKKWVRDELLTRIEGSGLRAFIDYRDYRPGAPRIEECQRGVEESRKTLLVLSPAYVAGEWEQSVDLMVQTLDPAARERRLIPLLKEDCEKPLRIRTLTHVDFTDQEELDLAWRQLLTALGKPPELEPAAEPQRSGWFLAHPYAMPPNFTGRIAERRMLSEWLGSDAADRLLILRALGGFGKSALVWHWLMHDVDPRVWPRVVWWSFYEGDASFESFLANTVHYLSKGAIQPQALSVREHLERLTSSLRQPGTLLVLDGIERALRAFGGMNAAYQGDEAAGSGTSDRDCISPLAEMLLRNVAGLPEIRARVLITTRLCPRVLEAKGGGFLLGCREHELTEMDPADAVAFFAAQGIRGTHGEIEEACRKYGYHPLSLRLLAGLIVHDFQQPGDIAAARWLDVSGNQVQRQRHVLESAYNSLTTDCQKLLGHIACFRNTVSYDALKVVSECSHDGSSLDKDLRNLITRGLVHHDPKQRRFDLHPIVRRYAYDRLTAPDRSAAHTRLRDYFAAVPEPNQVIRLEDLAPVIELFHHTVRAGQYDQARELFRDRISDAAYFQFGAYQLQIDLLRGLFPDGENREPRLNSARAQSWTLNELANSHDLSGQPRLAVQLLEKARGIDGREADKPNLAVGLTNLGGVLGDLGSLRTADAHIRQSIALCQDTGNKFDEASAHEYLGRLLAFRGLWTDSADELASAIGFFEEDDDVKGQGRVWAFRAERALRAKRSRILWPVEAGMTPLECARRALELAEECAQSRYPAERDFVLGHWLVGAAHRAASQYYDAERHLHEALQRCRRINLVHCEGEILIDLSRLRSATDQLDEARRLAEEALQITERCEYVLQGADAHLELAKLARDRGDLPAARQHAAEARRLAACDGPPDYTYKVAYDEAGALLDELK
jgi:tetratricopeptide (TPR) repeat protein